MKNKKLPQFVIDDFQKSYMRKFFMILPTHLHSAVVNHEITKTVTLPENIGEYKLQKDFQDDKPYPFKIGLYENEKGEKIVGKVWEGKIKNMHYFNLINEIVETHTLTELRKKSKDKLSKDIQNVFTPRYIDVIKEDGKLIFVSEFMTGEVFKMLPEKRKVDVYQKCMKYLKTLADNASDADWKLFRVRTAKSMLLQYPLLFAAAFMRRPHLIRYYLKALIVYLKALKNPNLKINNTIIHGDINYDNVMISESKISIIDVEQMMYTFTEYEGVTAISSARNTLPFSRWIIKTLLKDCYKDPEYARYVAYLFVNCETHNLTGNSSPASYKNHIKRLKLGFRIYDNSYSDKFRNFDEYYKDFNGLNDK